MKIFNAIFFCLCLITLTGCPNGQAQSPPASPSISFMTGDIFFTDSSTLPNVTIRNTSATAETFRPSISNASGITINDPNNCVNMSLAPGSTCTFTLSATANAKTAANNPAALTVVASANNLTANSSVSITLASPQVVINSSNVIDLTSGNSYTKTFPVTLVSGFNLQNTAVDPSSLPSGTVITANTCAGVTLSQSNPCSVTIHSNTAAAGTGTIGISGSNATTAVTQTIVVDNAAFTAQSPRTHLSAMSGTFSNFAGGPITVNSFSVAGSGSHPLSSGQMSFMTVDPDTHNASDLCTNGQVIAVNSSCKVWVKVTNGPDVTAAQTPATPQTGILSLNTNGGTFTLNLSVTTDLYAEGSTATKKYSGGTSWASILIGGAAGNNPYSADKTSLDLLLGAIDNGNVGYYYGTSTVGSLGASVTGDSMAAGSFSGGSNGGNNEYIFAHERTGLNQTLDITNGYGGTWATVTGTVGNDGANMLSGTLYTGDTNALYTSTNGTSSSAFSPSPANLGDITASALLNGTLYIVGNNSPYVKYYNGTAWVNGSVGNGDYLYGIVNWNNTLYASGVGGIYKLTGLPATFTNVSTTGQLFPFGFIATTNALYMMQYPFFYQDVQRCTGTGATVTCTSLGDPGIGDVDVVDDDIVVAPTLTMSSS